MKMIRAIVRPEKVEEVVDALDKAGFVALTKLDVLGRGKQKGIQVGSTIYEDLTKTMLMLVVRDEDAENVEKTIIAAARTGNYGDGKIFVSPVEEAYTIRTGDKGL